MESSALKPVKPNILLGISSHTPAITDEDEKLLDARFSAMPQKKCELCGASISDEFRHKLHLEKAWFNACGMCFYPANLDLIPSSNPRNIIYFPTLNQAMLNSVLRAIWAMNNLWALEPENQVLTEMCESTGQIEEFINSAKMITKSYFQCDDAAIVAATMGLLTPDMYRQRYKLFGSFRWLPDRSIFETEMAFWTKNDYNGLHPENMSGNITQFMTKYTPGFNLKE
mgnify:FL=1|tara:strand:+ start:2351 stop:3031 length:681 start_codon:yes stop_codon:yes gene_type:complete